MTTLRLWKRRSHICCLGTSITGIPTCSMAVSPNPLEKGKVVQLLIYISKINIGKTSTVTKAMVKGMRTAQTCLNTNILLTRKPQKAKPPLTYCSSLKNAYAKLSVSFLRHPLPQKGGMNRGRGGR